MRRIMPGILGGQHGLIGHRNIFANARRLGLQGLSGLMGLWLCGAQAQGLLTADGWVWNLSLPAEQGSDPSASPVFASGEQVQGRQDGRITLIGDAQLRRPGLVIRGDRIDHDGEAQSLQVQGHVSVQDQGNRYRGDALQLQLQTHEGNFSPVTFELDSGGRGTAQSIAFLGPQASEAKRVRYSTCPMPAGGNWSPDWVLDANSIAFDRSANEGTAWGSVLRFKGLPVMATPWLSFPLSDARKSGFLPLGMNLSDTSGLELVLPYYLNLAPNRDATLYPQLLSKRGVNWGGEYRYLLERQRGQVRADVMVKDRLRPDHQRYALSWQHQHELQWRDQPWGLSVNVNRVSDDNYWRDFPRSITTLTSRQLPTDVVASTQGSDWSFSLGSYQWQTLQQPDVIAPAYDRLPHAVVDWSPHASSGWGLRLHSELTQFQAQRADAENGWRWLGQLNMGQRWTWGPGFVAPALRVNARHYSLNSSLSRPGPWQGQRSASVWVPTASVKAGLAFERDLAQGGLQTLEPQLLLAYTPTRRQQGLPIYDVALKDFNLASVFSPDEYSGNDRIADNQSLTWGLTSRWLNAQGGEWLSLSWAQKQRLRALNVTWDDSAPLSAGTSDWLMGANWRRDANWSANAVVQYDLEVNRVRRSTTAIRYNQGAFRTAQLAYSYQRDASELMDLSWQWPLNDLWGDRGQLASGGGNLGAPRWYSVGRLNYSMRERQLVDAIAGIEYDAGCWMSRIAIERLQNSASTASHRLFFQLEFTGMGRLGSSPLESLQDNVPYYQVLRRQTVAPSRYENLE